MNVAATEPVRVARAGVCHIILRHFGERDR